MRVRFFPVLILAVLAASASAQVIRDPEVARRGAAVVYLSEVDAKVMQLPADIRAGYMDNPERIEQLIQGLLLDKQLAAEALELGLDKRPHFETELSLARDSILARRRTQQFLEDLEMPDFEVLARERYLGAKDKYTTPERLDVQHILIRAIGRTEADAEALAHEVHAMAVAGDKPFEALVAEYTEEVGGRGQKTDGMIRNMQRGAMVGEFEEAAYALTEPDQISPVVKTVYGYHVIRLVKRTPAQARPFEAVRGQIMGELRKEYVERAQKNHITTLRSMELSADEQVVASLRTRYMTDGGAGAGGAGADGSPTDGAAATASDG